MFPSSSAIVRTGSGSFMMKLRCCEPMPSAAICLGVKPNSGSASCTLPEGPGGMYRPLSACW